MKKFIIAATMGLFLASTAYADSNTEKQCILEATEKAIQVTMTALPHTLHQKANQDYQGANLSIQFIKGDCPGSLSDRQLQEWQAMIEQERQAILSKPDQSIQ